MANSEDASGKDKTKQDKRILSIIIGSWILGAVLILFSVASRDFSQSIAWGILTDVIRELGVAVFVASTAGILFEVSLQTSVISNYLGRNIKKLSDEFTNKMKDLSDDIVSTSDKTEASMNKLHDDILNENDILKNASEAGIEAVYVNRKDPDCHKRIIESIYESKTSVKFLGTSLADVMGMWGSLDELRQATDDAVRNALAEQPVMVLFPNPWKTGLVMRAKYDHPKDGYQNSRTYIQTTHKLRETVSMYEKEIKDGKLVIKLYEDLPICYLIITSERLFIENYHDAGRGTENVVLVFNKKSHIYKKYVEHFTVLWDNADEISKYTNKILILDPIKTTTT